jgi:hypothetical protein
MAPKPDQFFKDKFSKYLQDKNENDDAYSDDEYDTEENISGRLGGLGSILHDDDLDVPHAPVGRTGGISRGIGGISLGGRGLGSLGGRTGGSLGGLGSLGGRGIGASSSRGGGISSRGGPSGLGGLGRGKTSKNAGLESMSSSDNVRLSKNAGLESATTADVPKDSENMSKALGDIAKGTTALQKDVAAFINDSQQKNVEAFKEILHFIHGLEDRTVVHFKELSRLSASASASAPALDQPVDEALQALIGNIDKTLKDKNKDIVYILSPDFEKDSVDISELSKLLGKKDVKIVDNVRSLCDNIMSDTTSSEDKAPDKPTTFLPVQVANITPSSSPSKGFPPLRSPIMK